jgi:isopenicillin N synthase-like dioxygenase
MLLNPTTPTIPTIDVADPDAASLVRRACSEWGFFYVTNHGVPAETVRRTYDMSRRFFALTEAEKRTYVPARMFLSTSRVVPRCAQGSR